MSEYIQQIDSFNQAETVYPFAQTAADRTSAALPDSPRVLLIVADDDARFMMLTMLELWGYSVSEADGEEAAVAAAERARPSAILLDITLRYMDGIKTWRRLRRTPALSDAPVMFFSGHAQPAFRSIALALGISHFFVKPIDFNSLRDSLSAHTKSDFGGLSR